MSENPDDSFNASRAEVFEALSHPTRMRILQTLSVGPLGFSELKRETGIESSGLLAFHLGKLTGLVKLNPEGSYALTDEGREALRIIDAGRKQGEGHPSARTALHLPHQKAILAGLLVVLIVLGSVAVYQQEQIGALNNEISSNVVTINGVEYRHLSVPLQSVFDAKSIVFEGVNFTRYPQT
ncbi:MAG: helix-turn-helix domain-containing protein [Nitrososphaerales archaeon]